MVDPRFEHYNSNYSQFCTFFRLLITFKHMQTVEAGLELSLQKINVTGEQLIQEVCGGSHNVELDRIEA